MVSIAGSTFEGLFLRTLKVSGPIVQRLQAVGFNPEKMEPVYSVEVWRKSLQVAAGEYYPTLTAADAELQLGTRLVGGFLETIVGKVIAATLPFLSADTLCKRLPRFLSTGTVGMTPPVVTQVGDRHYTLTMFGENGLPWFTAGAIGAFLRMNKVSPSVSVKTVTAENFTLDIRWKP